MQPRKIIGTVSGSEFIVSICASIGFLLALGSAGLDLGIVAMMLLGGVIAAPLSAWLVSRFDDQALGTGVGALIIFLNLDRALSLFGVDPSIGLAAADRRRHRRRGRGRLAVPPQPEPAPSRLRGAGRLTPPEPLPYTRGVRVSARADYAIRALLELAAAGRDAPVRADAIARAQRIPSKFLENLLADLRRARLVVQPARARTAATGSRDRPPAITLADVIRAIDGPLAGVRDDAPEDVSYAGRRGEPARRLDRPSGEHAPRSSRATTLADVAGGKLPASVRRLLKDPEAWTRR